MFANYLSYTDRKTFATWDAVNIGRLHCLIKGWDDAAVNFLKSGGFVLSDKVQKNIHTYAPNTQYSDIQ
jgi:hypothetical protein